MHSLRTRAIAATTSAALAAAGLFAISHEIAERHEVCADHGERIHSEIGEKSDSHGHSEDNAVRDNKRDQDHGDHCGVAWFAPQSPEIGEPDLAELALFADPAIATLVSQAVPERATYRLAPKNSPPA